MPEQKKDFFRRHFTRKQLFVLLNVGSIGITCLQGGLEFTPKSITDMVFVLAVVNAGAYLSSKHYPDWK